MTIEGKLPETRKAGFVDKVVSVITFGKFGVNETVVFGFKDINTGEIFQESPMAHSLRTRKCVNVGDMSNIEHVLERKVVRRG